MTMLVGPAPRAGAAARLLALLALLAVSGACGRGDADGGEAGVDTVGLRLRAVPAEHREGEALYARSCAVCHGGAAVGSERGPPLVHVVYEPGHHADAAFLLAVQRGVRAHHWRFGDMAPLPDVSRQETEAIVGYVRWLQREAGIF